MNCENCGSEMQMTVQMIVSAPSSMRNNFTKTNMRKKEFKPIAVLWETEDYICDNCGHIIPGYIDYIRGLKRDLAAAYLEFNKIRPKIKAIFDREVWDKAAKSC